MMSTTAQVFVLSKSRQTLLVESSSLGPIRRRQGKVDRRRDRRAGEKEVTHGRSLGSSAQSVGAGRSDVARAATLVAHGRGLAGSGKMAGLLAVAADGLVLALRGTVARATTVVANNLACAVAALVAVTPAVSAHPTERTRRTASASRGSGSTTTTATGAARTTTASRGLSAALRSRTRLLGGRGAVLAHLDGAALQLSVVQLGNGVLGLGRRAELHNAKALGATAAVLRDVHRDHVAGAGHVRAQRVGRHLPGEVAHKDIGAPGGVEEREEE